MEDVYHHKAVFGRYAVDGLFACQAQVAFDILVCRIELERALKPQHALCHAVEAVIGASQIVTDAYRCYAVGNAGVDFCRLLILLLGKSLVGLGLQTVECGSFVSRAKCGEHQQPQQEYTYLSHLLTRK